MKYYIAMALGAVAIVAIGAFALHSWMEAERSAAVEAERRERTADAIEMIRDTDKLLGVQRKASNADLCRGMGGQPGECQ